MKPSTRPNLSRMHFRPVSPGRLVVLALAVLASISTAAHAGVPVPSFSKSFSPSTIGSGGTSTLRFDIINNDPVNPVADLAFTDVLPAGVTIAAPAQASTGCDGTLTAPDGGGTITFSDGLLGAGGTCSILVDVTSSSVGVHMNVSGDLTSDVGNSGPASADLTVATDRPGFTKSFSPSSVKLGERSTLTFTIDNTANASLMAFLSFVDSLPVGMVVAGPANASTTCSGGLVAASPGSNVISLSDGLILAGASCTVTVDVLATGVGQLGNTSGELTSARGGFTTVSSGKASAVLTATADALALQKSFTDDPVAPDGSVTLEFTITNFDRNFSATNVTFTDDLNATLAGLAATGLPANDVCGAGSQISGTTLLTLTGGDLAPGASCTFSVTLQVPVAATPGAYPNTTSTITGDVGGSMVVGGAATETLFVASVPVLTKTFLDNPAAAGSTTRMEFTITNTSPTSTATNIAFIDELTTFLPVPVSASLPATPCGAGSAVSLISLGFDREGLSLTGGTLGPGLSCTFEVSVDLPAGLPGGLYTNTTEEITATVDAATVTGNPATADFTVVAPPTLTKLFTDDPVLPGGTVTLEFTLEHNALAPADATAIAFTDDLDAALSGLVAIGLPMNDVCGAGSQISGTSSLSFTGGTLAPGASCTFAVTLQVPVGASSGTFTNTTSNVTATVSGLMATGLPGEDGLEVSVLAFTKQFLDDPAIPGGTVTLRFTIDNLGTLDATGLSFTDNLNAALPGLAPAPGLPLNDVCGAGSQLSAVGSFLSFAGGNLLAGTSCFFDVVLDVPLAAPIDTYLNVTSQLSSSLGNAPAASDTLVVDNNLLTLTKSFTDDPVEPGDTVTLEFTVTNLDLSNAASAITFTDDLGAALAGLAATGLPLNDVCGAGSQIAGTSLLTLTGGNLPAGGSCTFSVTVQVPAIVPLGSTAINTTSNVTGTITGLPVQGAPATDTLLIQSLAFTKSFDGPTAVNATPVLTFTLTNLSATATLNDISFSDDLDAFLPGLVATGLPVAGVCGAGSQIAGTSFLTLTGASLGPGESCTINVDLQMPAMIAPGSYVNTTSVVTAGGLQAAAATTATLVVEPPPTFSKAFAPTLVAVGGTSTLTFTIDNTASALLVSGLQFIDNLPAGLVVANPGNESTTCGGTVTATPGSASVSFSGGTAGAGATCTVSVDVTPSAPGSFNNVTSDLSSSNGTSGPAAATLDVVDNFTLSKVFLGNPVRPGEMIDLEYTIVNPSNETITAIGFSDDFDAVVSGLIVVGLPVSDVCGAGSMLTGTSVLTLAGGSLAPFASCTFRVTLEVPENAPLGTFPSISGPITGMLPSGAMIQAPGAEADLVVGGLSVIEIPTQSEWGLMLLAGLLALLALMRLRQL